MIKGKRTGKNEIVYVSEDFQIKVRMVLLEKTGTVVSTVKVHSMDEARGRYTGILYPDIIYSNSLKQFCMSMRSVPTVLSEDSLDVYGEGFRQAEAFIREANKYFSEHDILNPEG